MNQLCLPDMSLCGVFHAESINYITHKRKKMHHKNTVNFSIRFPCFSLRFRFLRFYSSFSLLAQKLIDRVCIALMKSISIVLHTFVVRAREIACLRCILLSQAVSRSNDDLPLLLGIEYRKKITNESHFFFCFHIVMSEICIIRDRFRCDLHYSRKSRKYMINLYLTNKCRKSNASRTASANVLIYCSHK